MQAVDTARHYASNQQPQSVAFHPCTELRPRRAQ